MTEMMITVAQDMDMVEEAFAAILEALGLGAWYECEDVWETIEETLLFMGFEEEIVSEFFTQMSWDL